MHPESKAYAKTDFTRSALFTSQEISQAIVIYLFVQFSKPVSFANDAQDQESDDELEDKRDANIDMLFYMGKGPKMMQRDVDYDID